MSVQGPPQAGAEGGTQRCQEDRRGGTCGCNHDAGDEAGRDGGR